eukprot:2304180-Prymnesium_polylepis.1
MRPTGTAPLTGTTTERPKGVRAAGGRRGRPTGPRSRRRPGWARARRSSAARAQEVSRAGDQLRAQP